MNVSLTSEEISDIADSMEFYKTPTTIDGQAITCYPMIYAFCTGTNKISDYSENQIKEAINQLTLEKELYQSIDVTGCLDLSLSDKLIALLGMPDYIPPASSEERIVMQRDLK